MKNTIAYALLILSLMSCKSENNPETGNEKKLSVAPCTDAKYTYLKEFSEVETIIVARSYSNPPEIKMLYFIKIPGSDGSIDWFACNFPDAFKKDNLAVRISGHQLTFPGIEATDMIGVPFELSSIVEVSK